MRRRNEFLTFVTACIPGVGYMYNGLKIKGVQILVLWLLISPVLNIVGLDFMETVIKLPFWLYTFFDTYNLAHKIDRGETFTDSEFVFKKYMDFNNYSENGGSKTVFNGKVKKEGWLFLGWGLVILGALGLINRLFINFDFYRLIRSTINQYFIPAVFIFLGAFLLFRKK